MTRDEILNMPAGMEMDALVAEMVMGWKSDPTVPYYDWIKNDEVIHISRKWSPSTDIAAAWEVVDKMLYDADGNPNKVHLLRFGNWEKKKQAKIVWECLYGPGWANLLDVAKAPTAPLAICRAALLAVVVE